MGDKREVNASDLRKVKEGFNALLEQLSPARLTLGQFATIIRKAEELATQVGGIEAVANCAETLKELQN
jgi:hypothetical protein